MEVGIGTGDFVLDGDPAPLPKKGAEPPSFWSMPIVCVCVHAFGRWFSNRLWVTV